MKAKREKRQKMRESDRYRKRNRLDTLIPGVPLNLYSRSFVVTIKHTLPLNRRTHAQREESIEIQRDMKRGMDGGREIE